MRDPPTQGGQARDAWSLEAEAWICCLPTEGMLTPLNSFVFGMAAKGLPNGIGYFGQILQALLGKGWETLWPNQSVPVPKGP